MENLQRTTNLQRTNKAFGSLNKWSAKTQHLRASNGGLSSAIPQRCWVVVSNIVSALPALRYHQFGSPTRVFGFRSPHKHYCLESVYREFYIARKQQKACETLIASSNYERYLWWIASQIIFLPGIDRANAWEDRGARQTPPLDSLMERHLGVSREIDGTRLDWNLRSVGWLTFQSREEFSHNNLNGTREGYHCRLYCGA